jgi:hypothetical protein
MAELGVARERAQLLAAGLVGISVTSAQFWLASGRRVAKDEAETLLAGLAWRGIAQFPVRSGTDSEA